MSATAGVVDEARERDEHRQHAGHDRGGSERRAGASDDAVGREPDERDQRERRDVEHVPLLDLFTDCCEANAATSSRSQTTIASDAAANARAAGDHVARREPEREQRGEREHAEVEVELGDVVEQEVQDVARPCSRSSSPRGRRRAASGERPRATVAEQREQRAAGEDPVERRERPQGGAAAPLEEREQDRRRRGGGHQRDRLLRASRYASAQSTSSTTWRARVGCSSVATSASAATRNSG